MVVSTVLPTVSDRPIIPLTQLQVFSLRQNCLPATLLTFAEDPPLSSPTIELVVCLAMEEETKNFFEAIQALPENHKRCSCSSLAPALLQLQIAPLLFLPPLFSPRTGGTGSASI